MSAEYDLHALPDASLTEADRLESIIALVFDNRHYSPKCHCIDCIDTRAMLSADDLKLIDFIAVTVRTSTDTPPNGKPL